MRLSVKVLGGAECCVDAKDDYTVEQLKRDIEAKLKLGKTEQKLLFKGKTLQGKLKRINAVLALSYQDLSFFRRDIFVSI